MNLASKFSFSNPLHIDLFPFVKQMEIEVIHMCSKMLNFANKKGIPVGSFNSGGT
jgi:glutamate/tyrosine decarboxylase-like PLP-dependent enzyme